MLFKEFFDQYILQEAAMDEVPRKLLGATSDIKNLPDNEPYGFWVDKSGNFRQVGRYGHEEAGEEMLLTTQNYLDKKNIPFEVKSIYRGMYDNGWVRIVWYGGRIHHMTGNTKKLASNHQLRFMKYLGELYDVEVNPKSDDI